MSPVRDRRVDLVLLAVAVVWGSSYLAAKVLVSDLGVLPVLALRYGAGVLALAAVLAVRRVRPGRVEWGLGCVLGLSQAAVLGLETWGVAGTTATHAGLLISLTILLTPVVEGVVQRSWLPPAFFGAGTLALTGVALLLVRTGSGGGLHGPTAGDLLVLGAAVVRAGHVTALGRLTRTRPVDLVGLTFVQTVVGAVAFTVLDPAGLVAAVGSAGAGQWAGIGYLALACGVFAFLAQTWAVRRTSAARASLLLGTEPLWAVVVGVALGGEVLGAAGVAGAVLVVAGTAWGQRVEGAARTSAGPPLEGVAVEVDARPRRPVAGPPPAAGAGAGAPDDRSAAAARMTG